MRCPPSRTRTCLSPAQSRTVRPVIAGPGQTCCPAIQKLPGEGTSRPGSTALPCPLSLPGPAGRRSRPVIRLGFSGGSGKPRLPGQLGGYPQAESGFGEATWRCSTAISCLNTKISTSFEAPLRASSASQANARDTAR
jgi:hypothetical protein